MPPLKEIFGARIDLGRGSHADVLLPAVQLADGPLDYAWAAAQTRTGGIKAEWDQPGRKPLYGDAARRALEQQTSREEMPLFGNGGPAQEQPTAQQPAVEQPGSLAAAAADYKTNGVRAAAFKAWFGDWEHDPATASKVVDPETGEPKETHEMSAVVNEDGKPVKVFHGSPAGGWKSFDKSKMIDPQALLYGPGFYFTEDQGIAGEYSGESSFRASVSDFNSPEEAQRDLETNKDKYLAKVIPASRKGARLEVEKVDGQKMASDYCGCWIGND